MKKTKVYKMEVTVSVTLPDDYQEHIDEYGESECEHACYSAVSQTFGILGHNSKAVKGAASKWLSIFTECEKAEFFEEC
jgi:hypothetical protein